MVVRSADDRTAVLGARSALVPGQRLADADLVRVEVNLGSAQGQYLAATDLAPGRVMLRPVAAGELVPRGAVGPPEAAGVQPLMFGVDAGAAASLQVGTEVDVYTDLPADSSSTSASAASAAVGAPASVGSPSAASSFLGPELVLERATVSSLPSSGAGFGPAATGDRPVQVMVPTDRVKDLIARVDRGARVTLVPVAGTAVHVDR